MRHGSLFSGIGGFDLAASWMRWENVFHCEKDPFCRKVLHYYWPKADSYADIHEFNAVKYRGRVDILSGGFPCQPFSQVGKRKGTADPRHLWPEMCRIIGEVQPRWVVGENVYGLINWNRGLVFEQVHLDLESAGYQVQTYILPAAAVNAPHRRARIWFVANAHAVCDQQSQRTVNAKENAQTQGCRPGGAVTRMPGRTGELDPERTVADPGEFTDSPQSGERKRPDPKPLSQRDNLRRDAAATSFAGGAPNAGIPDWRTWPAQSPVCGGDDGVSLALDGITLSKWREESMKAYGNAIVPQVALRLFKTVQLLEEGYLSNTTI